MSQAGGGGDSLSDEAKTMNEPISALASVRDQRKLPDVVTIQFKVQEFEIHLTSDIIYRSCEIFMGSRPTARYRMKTTLP